MTITLNQLFLYASALILLFLTPGPVWIAIVARTVSDGIKSGLSLVLGVLFGDLLWPFFVYGSVSILTLPFSNISIIMKYLAASILIGIGIQTILSSRKNINTNEKLTKTGFSAGFFAGLFAVIANPKAALFYFTLLPNFFTIQSLAFLDLILISSISSVIPAIGNILIILFLLKARSFLSSPKSIALTNVIAGILLILVGFVIALF